MGGSPGRRYYSAFGWKIFSILPGAGRNPATAQARAAFSLHEQSKRGFHHVREPRRQALATAFALSLARFAFTARRPAIVGPGQIDTAPGEAAAESGEQQPIAGLELLLVVPQAKRNRAGGSVAVFVDGHHHAVERQAHALARRFDDAL